MLQVKKQHLKVKFFTWAPMTIWDNSSSARYFRQKFPNPYPTTPLTAHNKDQSTQAEDESALLVYLIIIFLYCKSCGPESAMGPGDSSFSRQKGLTVFTESATHLAPVEDSKNPTQISDRIKSASTPQNIRPGQSQVDAKNLNNVLQLNKSPNIGEH